MRNENEPDGRGLDVSTESQKTSTADLIWGIVQSASGIGLIKFGLLLITIMWMVGFGASYVFTVTGLASVVLGIITLSRGLQTISKVLL
jgi:hypothetical protein